METLSARIDIAGDTPEDGAVAYEQRLHALCANPVKAAQIIAMAEAGCAFCLREAEQLSDAPIRANRLRLSAKTLAFSAAAHCWPGWGDSAHECTREDIQRAVLLAEESLRLSEQLGLGPVQSGNALWLMGVLELEGGDGRRSAALLHEAAKKLEAANELQSATLVRGYEALARHASGTLSTAEFKATLSAVHVDATTDSQLIADRLFQSAQTLPES